MVKISRYDWRSEENRTVTNRLVAEVKGLNPDFQPFEIRGQYYYYLYKSDIKYIQFCVQKQHTHILKILANRGRSLIEERQIPREYVGGELKE